MRTQEQTQNQVMVFSNIQFGKVRVVEIDGQPWWVLSDVCKALGLLNPTTVANRLESDEKVFFKPKSDLGLNLPNRGVTVISESGLYAVILRSDKPNAQAFRKWLTMEVIPTIRKTGCYVTDELRQRLAESEDERNHFFEDLLKERNAKKSLEKKKRALKADLVGVLTENEGLRVETEILEDCIGVILPKAEYCETVLECENAMPVTIIAKDYNMSATRFNQLLRDIGVQYKVSGTWVLRQHYTGLGYTESVTIQKGGKAIVLTVWTQRGRRFLYDILEFYGITPTAERS